MPDFKESAGIPMNAFTQTHRTQMEAIAAQCRASLLNQVVPFWTERVVDPLHGGYRTCFDSNGTLYNSNKHGWFLGRTMYTFSVLCQEFGTRPEWLSIAKAGYDFMEASSVGDGRFALLLSPENAVLNGAESIFTDHFVVKGLIHRNLSKRVHCLTSCLSTLPNPMCFLLNARTLGSKNMRSTS